MFRDPAEVRVGRQEGELEADAELCEEGVDRAHLEPVPPAVVPQIRGCDVILALGSKTGKRGEPIDDRVACLRAAKALQELLKNEPGREYGFSPAERLPETGDLGREMRGVAAQR